MKEGWVQESLVNCFKLKSGDGLTAKNMVHGTYPVFGGNGIAGYHEKKNLSGSHVIVGRVGALCGNARLVNEDIWLTDNAFKVTGFKHEFDLHFLTYLLNHIQLRKYARQAAQPVISNSSLRHVIITFPTSLSEQKRIVAKLDKAFAAIDQAKANLEKNIENAKELFQSKLNAIFSQKGDGWEEKKLGEVCSIESKLVNPQKAEHQKLLHVGGSNIVSETGELVNLKTSADEGLKSGKFYFQNDVVLYNKIRPYLIKVCRPSFSGLCSADMYPLTPKKENITRDFLYFLLISKDFTDYAISGSARAGMPKVNRTHLFEYNFSLPSIEAQNHALLSLNQMKTTYQSLQAYYQEKLTSLEELKKSLLQKAFAGELSAP